MNAMSALMLYCRNHSSLGLMLLPLFTELEHFQNIFPNEMELGGS